VKRLSFNRKRKIVPTQTSGGHRNYDLYGQTVRNIPQTLGGPREWYPGAVLETLPSVVADIAGASGPRRTMHGQEIHAQSCRSNQNPEMVPIEAGLPATAQDGEVIAAQTALDAFPILKRILTGE